MNRLKITRLKLSAAAVSQMDALGVSLADLAFVIRFARSVGQDESQTCRFDIERVPSEIRDELQHLVGVEFRIVSRSIVSVTRTTISETDSRSSQSSANDEEKEESI